MGCDIHLYLEMKNRHGKWEEIKCPKEILPDDRNYELFSFLANVRNYVNEKITPQFADRGFPKDTSMPENDTEDFWLGDHSFTYAYLDEILAAPWDQYQLENNYFIIFCRYVLPRLCSFTGWLSKEEQRNVRIIMGFDN